MLQVTVGKVTLNPFIIHNSKRNSNGDARSYSG